MSYYPRPCPNCLRRARLLAHLAPYIERFASGLRGDRLAGLLGRENYELAESVAPDTAPALLNCVREISDEQLETELAESGCWCCCRHDPRFPVGLREAPGAPWALFGRGDPTLIQQLQPEAAVTIVGARRASTYGRDVARELGRDLASAGLLIISGLSFGVEACAHRGALDCGKTVAVLGTG
ncbi:MAG TPA: DNA-processing protein DprA, partial [Solirubrobacterales bacterium]|nr:DNA-processing protein DprA [Solirubrobacterales bacterium]